MNLISPDYVKTIRNRYEDGLITNTLSERDEAACLAFLQMFDPEYSDSARSDLTEFVAEPHIPTAYHRGKIGGVCAWIGNEFDLSASQVTALRIASLFGLFMWGATLWVYMVLLLLKENQ